LNHVPSWRALSVPCGRRVDNSRRSFSIDSLARVPYILLVGIILAVFVVGAAFATGVVHVQSPEGSTSREQLLVPPLQAPTDAVTYVRDTPQQVAATTGGAVAYLANPPTNIDELTKVGVTGFSSPMGATSIRLQSIVEYTGGGHTVVVALHELAPELAGANSLVLGDRTVELDNGRRGWSSVRPNWHQRQVVMFTDDFYLVVVASDLPGEAVERMASDVRVIRPTLQSQRSPSGLSARVPSEPRVRRAEMSATGRIRRFVDPMRELLSHGPTGVLGLLTGKRVQIEYSVQVGNYGDSVADDVAASVAFPGALALRMLDVVASGRWAELGEGATAGFGGTMTLDASSLERSSLDSALREGLRVRLSWHDHGQKVERQITID